MTSFFQSLFSSSSLSNSGRKPSFNDFSMHTGYDAEDEIAEPASQPTSARTSTDEVNPNPKRVNVWQDTFSPQMNSNMRRPSANYYDAPSKTSPDKSVWEHIIKADHVKHAAFASFDVNNDGLIDASDLRARLGADADVEKLIKQADRNGDGKIDQAEFTELLKNM